MRIATYNVEWFTNLFDDDGRLQEDTARSSRHGVSRAGQLRALGAVFAALDADAVLVIEAPDTNRRRSTVAMLERFAARFSLRTRSALIGFPSETQQEIALLYDPDRLVARHDPKGRPPGTAAPGTAPPGSAPSGPTPSGPVPPGQTHGGRPWSSPRFDGTMPVQLGLDALRDTARFSKPPLELAVQTVGGKNLHLIGIHVKSKAPHGASSAEAVARLGALNRRKQLAECLWLRARVVEHLTAGDSLIVLGDFNDGPGIDTYEAILGRSAVEIVAGEDGPAHLRLNDPHARPVAAGPGGGERVGQGAGPANRPQDRPGYELASGSGGVQGTAPVAGASEAHAVPTGTRPASARFYNDQAGGHFGAMVDFVMLSPDLLAMGPRWRIWHPDDDPDLARDPLLRAALLAASDHFPVSVDLGV